MLLLGKPLQQHWSWSACFKLLVDMVHEKDGFLCEFTYGTRLSTDFIGQYMRKKRKLNERSGACETLPRLDYKPLFGKELTPDSRERRSKMFKCQFKKCHCLLSSMGSASSKARCLNWKKQKLNLSTKQNRVKKSQLAWSRSVGYLQALQRSWTRV